MIAGSTIRFQCTFRDFAAEGDEGAIVDTDSMEAAVTIYDAGYFPISTGDAARVSAGVFTFDYQTSSEPATYVVEFAGIVDGESRVNRLMIRTTFVQSS